jgi:ATP-dependent RNA helicase RhlB
MKQQHLAEMAFSDLALHESLRQGLTDAGFEHCTPIQAHSLPLALNGHDVAGQAQTGTGKTAAFLLAAMNHVLTHPPSPKRTQNQPRILIVAPTRELAIQIHKDAEELGSHTGLTMGVVYGGTGYDTQRKMLQEGLDLVVGTPGRLIDYYKQHVYDLNAVQVMVLDEADRMFDLGFIRDIRYILRRIPLPEKRLGLLFSATLSFRVTELAYEHMNNPEAVRVEPERVTAQKVKQAAYFTANEEKIPLLIGLMRHMDPLRTIVFVNTRRVAERVWSYLEANDFPASILSGDVPQRKRQSLLRKFHAGEVSALVATDVAARGLHIPDVSHVINFDLPQDAEDYVHRIGRTARLGASGDAISFACEEYAFSLPEIEAFIGQKIESAPVSDELLVEVKRPKGGPRRHSAGVKRPSGAPRKHGVRNRHHNSRAHKRS